MVRTAKSEIYLGNAGSSVFDGVDGIGTGLLMSNGGSSGTGAGLSTITIGAEGSLFGNLFGILSNSALKIINNGEIVSDNSAIVFDSYGATNGLGSEVAPNLNTIVAGVARVATVTNAVGAVIGAETKGIVNYSDATLVVTNAGEIFGGQRTFGTFEFYEDEFAINSYGRLTLTNSATGTVYGGVGAQWLGSTVTNAGNIYGTIEMYISQYEFGGRIDVNRDGDTDDAGDLFSNNPLLVGLTVNNSGFIDGYDGYISYSNPDYPDEPPVEYEVAIDASQVRDVITNTATGVIYGEINTYRGSDAITNAGRIDGYIDMGGGNDVLTNAATGVMTHYGRDIIDMNEGNDTLTNLGQIDGDVFMNDGADSVSNSGRMGALLMEGRLT